MKGEIPQDYHDSKTNDLENEAAQHFSGNYMSTAEGLADNRLNTRPFLRLNKIKADPKTPAISKGKTDLAG